MQTIQSNGLNVIFDQDLAPITGFSRATRLVVKGVINLFIQPTLAPALLVCGTLMIILIPY